MQDKQIRTPLGRKDISGILVKDRLPFEETKEVRGSFIRTFDQSISEEELLWHRDPEDRTVRSIAKTDWMLQVDNCVPISLNEDIFIPKETYHRLIKGNGTLKISMIKHNAKK